MRIDHEQLDERAQLLRATPATEERLVLAGVPTAVLVGGDGPPLVLLHGPGEFSFTWLRIVRELVKSHRVIVPDLPGHGASRLGDAPLDTERVLAWLTDLVDHTCSSPPHLAGHLLGGAIAARFAVRSGDRLRGLVLVDTFGLRRLRPSPMFTITMAGFLAHPSDGSRDRFFRYCFADMDGLQQQLGETWGPMMAYALRGARSPDQKAALRSLMPRFAWRALPDQDLATISVPTALVWGRHDRQTPVTVAERASARYGWPLHVIEDAADDPAIEQPQAVLRAFAAAGVS